MKKYGANIFAKLDYGLMNTNLLNLLKVTLDINSTNHSFEAKNIIHNALAIWAGSLINKPELFA